MMENLRESAKGPVVKGILYLVIFAFIFSGGSMVFNSVVGDNAATVNGEDISNAELENSFQMSKSRYGDMFDRLFSNEEAVARFRRNVLDQLVTEKLTEQAVNDLGLRVNNDMIAKMIKEIPQFQKDGVYDQETAEAILRANQLTKESFIAQQRKAQANQQFVRALINTSFALESEVQFNYEMDHQERDLRYVRLPRDKFIAEAKIDEQQVEAYYNDNQSRYENAERIKLDYVSLELADLKKNTVVGEDEALEKFNQINDNESTKDTYKKEARRKAAHILIELGDDEAAAEKTIKEIEEKIKAGEDFGTLAKTLSADTVSAENLGELDWFGREEMDPAFEKAAFALEKVGDVSEIVKSEFGYHLIKLTGIEAEGYLSFEEVKADIIEQLKDERAREKFYEFKEIFEDKALEIVDSLDEIANAIEAEVKSSDFMTRTTGIGLFANPAVKAAAFGSDVMADTNSELIAVNDWHYVVLRKNEYQPATVKPLEEVKASIETLLKQEFAEEKAMEKGKSLIAKLKNNETIESDLKALEVEWKEEKAVKRTASNLDFTIRTAAFKPARIDKDKGTLIQGEALSNGDYAIIEISAIRSGDFSKADKATKQQIVDRISRANGEAEIRIFIEWLKKNSDINISI